MFREDDLLHFHQTSMPKNNLWGIVLAGGEGTRLKNLVKRLYGYHRPKQFCTLTGARSLIKQTINRASKIIPSKNILTVVTSHHSKFYREELCNRPEETIIVQPCPRGTSAGILLPVAKIYKSDPDSTVAIFPSDHFILEENKFMNYVREASIFVDRNPDLIVIVGIRPDKSETGFGWIEQGEKINSLNDLNFLQIRKFWEKPGLVIADSLFALGCLMNTFIVVGKSKTIINQMENRLPQLSEAFTPIFKSLGTENEKITIEQFFKLIPEGDFSKDFLEKICDHLAVLEIPDVYWSDWGEEQRITHDMKRFNLSFPHKIIPYTETIEMLHSTGV
jgi:mannose-1-phosphate guanylyltransferase